MKNESTIIINVCPFCKNDRNPPNIECKLSHREHTGKTYIVFQKASIATGPKNKTLAKLF
jgi:hypothetical protein